MNPSRLFRYLDFISTYHGVSCFPIESKIKKWSLIFIQIFSHFYFIQQLCGVLTDAYIARDWKIILASNYYIFSFVGFVAIAFNLKAPVIKIITFAERFLSDAIKENVIKIEIAILISYLIWFLFYATLSFFYRSADIFYPTLNGTGTFEQHYSWIPTPKGNLFLAFSSALIQGMVHAFIADQVIYVLIYCYLAYLISVIKNSFLDQLIKSQVAPIKELKIIWFEIVALRNHFEGSLSLVPFLALANVFMNATYVVCNFLGSKHSMTGVNEKQITNETLIGGDESAQMNAGIRKIVQWSFELGFAIPILVLPFLISWIQKKLNFHFEAIQLQLIHNLEKTPKLAPLIDEVKSNLDMNLTGWGMFKLNKELVLAFLGSIVTFSVLFLQLTQS